MTGKDTEAEQGQGRETDAPEQQGHSKPDNRRLHVRVTLDRFGQLQVRGQSHDCRILEISGSGAALLCSVKAEVGEDVTLNIPEIGYLPAKISREIIDGYGVSFDLPNVRKEDLSLRLRILTDLRRFM